MEKKPNRSRKPGLNERQKQFCKEYLVDFNASAAAVRAGYSPNGSRNTAFNLLTRPHIQAEVKKNIAKIADRAELNTEYVLRNLMEVMERCMQKEPVMDIDGQKKEDGKNMWQFNAAQANRSLELLGKYLSLFTEKIKHEGEVGVNFVDSIPQK